MLHTWMSWLEKEKEVFVLYKGLGEKAKLNVDYSFSLEKINPFKDSNRPNKLIKLHFEGL